MFVAWRDLRFARGRFLLIGSVVALITVLVQFLSGLTAGLAAQNVSAILSLPADRVVFSPPAGDGGPDMGDSAVTPDQAAAWAAAPGVGGVEPVGVAQVRVEAGGARVPAALLGVRPGFVAGPALEDHTLEDGTLALSEPAAADLDVRVGDTVSVAGTAYRVATIGGDSWFSHTPVVWGTLHDWQAHAASTGTPDAFATLLAVTGDTDWSAADAGAQTVSESRLGSLVAIGSFRSETGSLLLMVVMLFVVSALVVGAFFTVWSMQRSADVAVLKALGASTRSLVRDAFGQALVVLLVGTGLGTALVALLGSLVGGVLPFVLDPLTTLVPAAAMTALGLVGAATALRSVTSADPLTALGSNR